MPDAERSVGNIYLGRVNKIIQGINAAFIDIGLNQDGFLHFSDIDESLENVITEEEDDEIEDSADVFDGLKNIPDLNEQNKNADVALRKVKPQATQSDNKAAVFKTKKLGSFTINLEPKQNVLVQVVREAYGSKGVRVTTKIGIPGTLRCLYAF